MEEPQPKRPRRTLLAGLAAGVLALGALGAGVAGANAGGATDERGGNAGFVQQQQPDERGQDRNRDCPEKDGQRDGGGAQEGTDPDVSL